MAQSVASVTGGEDWELHDVCFYPTHFGFENWRDGEDGSWGRKELTGYRLL